MARRNSPRLADGGDVRAAMLAALRVKLTTASRERVTSADGRGVYASVHDEMLRQIDVLERGEALDVFSQALPEPWRSEYRPPRRVVIEPDGRVEPAPTGMP
jgi:hypothetical protein